MAFTGVAVTEKISDGLYRITGLSLGIGAAGTISMSPGAGEVKITDKEWQPLSSVNLADAVQVAIGAAGVVTVAPAVYVVKTGSTQADFLATLTNGGAALSGALELYVRFH
jgi:hypothetical protein